MKIIRQMKTSEAPNATNAWNVNLNNGNVNNNTKTNGNRVRPVSAFNNERRTGGSVSFHDVFVGLLEADAKCRKGKRNTPGEAGFEIDAPRKLHRIAGDLPAGTFDPGHCSAFLKPNPVLREIFASQYRARVVQTWAVIRVQPILESVLDPCQMSNRPGRGTSAAWQLAQELGEKFRRGGWVWSFDFRGFFMSIDKRIAVRLWDGIIAERYDGADKALLLDVVRDLIMRCPQVGCHINGDPAEWDALPPHKSLFAQDEFHGLVIGDHLSQLTALLILLQIVKWLRAHGVDAFIEYVDDFLGFTADPEGFKAVLPELRAYAWQEMGLVLHPHKFSLQQTRHGWHFVGCKGKPGVAMASDRSVRNFRAAVRRRTTLDKYVASVNSYLGLLQAFDAFRVKLAELPTILRRLAGRGYLTARMGGIRLFKKFTLREGLRRQVRVLRQQFINSLNIYRNEENPSPCFA